MKRCCRCKETKDISLFNKNKSTKDGYHSECKLCKKEYKKNNPKIVKAAKRREIEKGKAAEYSKRWKSKNKQKVYNYKQSRRSKISKKRFKIYDKEINNIYNSKCFACNSDKNITIDHVIPISRGGRHSIGNLIPMCIKCNMSKGSKLLSEFLYIK